MRSLQYTSKAFTLCDLHSVNFWLCMLGDHPHRMDDTTVLPWQPARTEALSYIHAFPIHRHYKHVGNRKPTKRGAMNGRIWMSFHSCQWQMRSIHEAYQSACQPKSTVHGETFRVWFLKRLRIRHSRFEGNGVRGAPLVVTDLERTAGEAPFSVASAVGGAIALKPWTHSLR